MRQLKIERSRVPTVTYVLFVCLAHDREPARARIAAQDFSIVPNEYDTHITQVYRIYIPYTCGHVVVVYMLFSFWYGMRAPSSSSIGAARDALRTRARLARTSVQHGAARARLVRSAYCFSTQVFSVYERS